MGNRTNLLVFVLVQAFIISNFAFADCYGDPGNGMTYGDCDAPAAAAPAATYSNENRRIAQQPATSQSKAPAKTAAKSSSAGFSTSCKFDISELRFVGESFGGSTTCVSARNDTEASVRCPSGTRFINPENPQYKKGAVGTQDSNPTGFYFCNTGRRKQEMCATAGTKYPKLKYSWTNVGNVLHKDGVCECDKDRNSPGLEDCSQPDVAVATGQQCDEATGMIKDSSGNCACDTAAGYEESGKACKLKPVATEPTKPVNPAEVTPALKECVDNKAKESLQCSVSATAANKKCDEDNKTNKEVNSAIAMPGQIAAQFISSKQGSGMQTECMKAGAIGQGTKGLMGALKESCDAELATCDKECDLNKKEQEYIDACFALVTKPSDAAASEGESTPDLDYYHIKFNEVRKNIGEGIPICKHDAVKKKDKLNDLLLGLANVINAGMTCACQVAATAVGASTSSCNSLPTAEQCAANPALPGCNALEVFDICTMGSKSYSATGCKCQQDPKGVGCAQYAAANPNNSGFAGAGIKNPASSGMFGPTDGAGGAGGGGGDKIDLSAKADDGAPNAKAGGGAGPGFLGGSQGAGGGGVSAPSGSGEQAAAKEEAEEAKGVGGLWGQAKSAVGSMFGGGSVKTNPEKSLNGKVNPDLDKFRPKGLRGLAGGNMLGGKNMDIWKMLHSSYEESEPTFIPTP